MICSIIHIYCHFRRLEEYQDLSTHVIQLLTQALARELKADLFGFDVLLSRKDELLYVVDVNILPGYKGKRIRMTNNLL